MKLVWRFYARELWLPVLRVTFWLANALVKAGMALNWWGLRLNDVLLEEIRADRLELERDKGR